MEQSNVSCLLVNTSLDSQLGCNWHKKLLSRSSFRFLCHLVNTYKDSQTGWSCAAIPYWSCYWDKKLLHGAVAGFRASSSILLETLNWGGVGQVNPVRAVFVRRSSCCVAVLGFCFSSSTLLRTPNQGGNGQLSPIRAVIVTRSSCREQLQVAIFPRQYFMSAQLRWSWAAISH